MNIRANPYTIPLSKSQTLLTSKSKILSQVNPLFCQSQNNRIHLNPGIKSTSQMKASSLIIPQSLKRKKSTTISAKHQKTWRSLESTRKKIPPKRKSPHFLCGIFLISPAKAVLPNFPYLSRIQAVKKLQVRSKIRDLRDN